MRKLSIVVALLVVLSTVSIAVREVRADIVVESIDFVGLVDGEYQNSTSATEWIKVWNFSVYHYCSNNGGVTVTVSSDMDTQATVLEFNTGSGYWQGMIAVYDEPIPYYKNASVRVTFSASGNNYGVGALVITKTGAKYAVIHYYGKDDGHNDNRVVSSYPSVTTVKIEDLQPGEFTFNPVQDLLNANVSVNIDDITHIKFFVETVVETHYNKQASFTLVKVELLSPSGIITLTLKEALSGQPLQGVTVREGDQVLGTINSGDSIELPKGTHTLTFEKQGYWSKTITIDVQSDTTVEVEMYPSSAAVMIEAPSNITTFENTLTEVKLQIEPIAQEATKNAYLSVSGITPLEVRKDASIISSENGKYYLGDISSPTEITIKFKADTPGTKTFSVTITSQDALGTKTYEATKQIVYTVKQLPFQVQLPTWSVGENEVRINEASGQQVLITLSLLDQNGTEIWSDSYTFGPYEGHAFTVNIPAEGDYTLEVSWNGYTAVWSIKVNPAVSILTDTVNVGKGDIGTIKVKIRNPTSRTQYYTVVLEGGFIEGNVTKQIAVAPLSEKTIDIAFSVPKDVQFDAYDLTLRVLQGNATTYQGLVHVIVEDTGFSLPLGGEGPLGLPLWMWGVLGVVAFLLIVREVRR